MTEEELNRLPWQFQCHLAMEHEHCSTYNAEYNGHRFGVCNHTPIDSATMEPHGRRYRHWMLDGKVYKTRKKFLEAIANI